MPRPTDQPPTIQPPTEQPVTADYPDVWDGLRQPSRGYPVAPPPMPHLVRWREPLRDRIRGAQRREEVTTVRRGVYLSATDPQQDRELAAIAAVLARLITPFALTHTSAARVTGLWTPVWDGVVHVSQASKPSGRSSRDPGLRRHRRHLEPGVLRTRHGLVLTSVELTAVDCALIMPTPRALPIVDSALLIGGDKDEMLRLLGARTGQRGVAGARATVLLATARIGSPAESRVRARIVLPEPSTLIDVETEIGRLEIDLGWPDLRVGIEVHGRGKYRAGADPVAEAVRRQALFDAGWRIVEIRTGETPAEYLPRVRRAFQLGGVMR